MKAHRAFRPTVQQVEARIVLSFSLTSIMDSVFPGLIKHHSKPKPKPASTHPALVKHAKAPAHVAAVHPAHVAAAHPAHVAAAHPAHVAAQTRGIHAMQHPRKA